MKRPGARRPAATARAPRARPARQALPWLIGAAGAALLAFGWWGLRTQPARSTAGPDTPWGEAALASGPVEAFARGAALADSGRAYASLPFLHHAVAAPGAPWQAWRAYASALYNAAMTGAHDPLTHRDPVPRSSFERVALMREAFPRIERAITLTNAPAERAVAQLTRAQFLRTWGFSWDALQDFHMAGDLDPQWQAQSHLFAAHMRDPTIPLEDPGPSGR